MRLNKPDPDGGTYRYPEQHDHDCANTAAGF
jgi:hypothetical protein